MRIMLLYQVKRNVVMENFQIKLYEKFITK